MLAGVCGIFLYCFGNDYTSVFLMPKIRRKSPPNIFGLFTNTTFIKKPPQQFLQRTMPLTIKAMDRKTTRNLEGNIIARISPAPNITKINPRLPPLALFMSTPPFLLLLHYMRYRKKCSNIFIGNKNQRSTLFRRYTRHVCRDFVAYTQAAERRKCIV